MVTKEYKKIFDTIKDSKTQNKNYTEIVNDLRGKGIATEAMKEPLTEFYIYDYAKKALAKGHKLKDVKNYLKKQNVDQVLVNRALSRFKSTIKWILIGSMVAIALLLFALAGPVVYDYYEEQTNQCVDEDLDGFGISEIIDCTYSFQEDCDDLDPNVNPGVLELCYDGIDNDCDTFIDEDCELVEEESSGDIAEYIQPDDDSSDGAIDTETSFALNIPEISENGVLVFDADIAVAEIPEPETAIDTESDFVPAAIPDDCDIIVPECGDGIDNDGDGTYDNGGYVDDAGKRYPRDEQCNGWYDNSESIKMDNLCGDGQDNDFDGKTDIDDSCCASINDPSETWKPSIRIGDTTCSDEIDNDNDGNMDFAGVCRVPTRSRIETMPCSNDNTYAPSSGEECILSTGVSCNSVEGVFVFGDSECYSPFYDEKGSVTSEDDRGFVTRILAPIFGRFILVN